MSKKVAQIAATLTLATVVMGAKVGTPLDAEDAREVPDWQDWFSPMWLEEHKGERIGHGYRQFRAGGENAGAISMGYKFAEGNRGLSAEDLKDEWSLETTVNVKNSTPGTYFMSVGWAPAGYGGIQELPNSDRTIIFSMWNGGCQFGTAGDRKEPR